MKLSKKLRFLFSLTSLVVCLCMGSVVVNADMILPETEEATTLEEDTQTYADGKITLGTAKSMVEQMASAISQVSSASKEELEYVAGVMSYQTDMYTNFAKTVGDEGAGALVSYDNVKVAETDEKDKVEVTADMHFENKDLKLIMHVSCFDTIGAQITSTEFSLADAGEESLGSKMATAGSNTLMGMGVVFFVLIFICLIISCFNFIPKITEKLEKRKAGKVEVAKDTPVTPKTMQSNVVEENDTELIAVIAAAIAASEHTSTDSFVVRSIRRR